MRYDTEWDDDIAVVVILMMMIVVVVPLCEKKRVIIIIIIIRRLFSNRLGMYVVCCVVCCFVVLLCMDFMNVSLTTLMSHYKNESIFVVEDCDRSIHHQIIVVFDVLSTGSCIGCIS